MKGYIEWLTEYDLNPDYARGWLLLLHICVGTLSVLVGGITLLAWLVDSYGPIWLLLIPFLVFVLPIIYYNYQRIKKRRGIKRQIKELV